MESVKKYALYQAVSFWLGCLFGVIMLWAVINSPADGLSGTMRTIFTSVFCLQLFDGLVFVISSAYLAKAVKKSPVAWALIPIFLGPIGYMLTYAMLSTTAKRLLQVATK